MSGDSGLGTRDWQAGAGGSKPIADVGEGGQEAPSPQPPAPSPRIAHVSDIHFGKIAHPGVVDALVAEANGLGVDLVAVSGDLTQRARRREFAAARATLDAFEPPTLVVPGNHDVRAWWHNPVDRVFKSSRRFRKYVSPDVTPSFTAPGLAAFGLNSAYGLTIKGGLVRPRHLAEMRTFFGEQPEGCLRVLVLHHHLQRMRELGDHDVARGARLALEAVAACGVELVLCGHLHRSHAAHAERVRTAAGRPVLIVSAGTATSSRGRGDNAGVNFYNVVSVTPDAITVEERRFVPDAGAFETAREQAFERG